MVEIQLRLAAVGMSHDEAAEDEEELDKQVGVGEEGPLRDAADQVSVVEHNRYRANTAQAVQRVKSSHLLHTNPRSVAIARKRLKQPIGFGRVNTSGQTIAQH